METPRSLGCPRQEQLVQPGTDLVPRLEGLGAGGGCSPDPILTESRPPSSSNLESRPTGAGGCKKAQGSLQFGRAEVRLRSGCSAPRGGRVDALGHKHPARSQASAWCDLPPAIPLLRDEVQPKGVAGGAKARNEVLLRGGSRGLCRS